MTVTNIFKSYDIKVHLYNTLHNLVQTLVNNFSALTTVITYICLYNERRKTRVLIGLEECVIRV